MKLLDKAITEHRNKPIIAKAKKKCFENLFYLVLTGSLVLALPFFLTYFLLFYSAMLSFWMIYSTGRDLNAPYSLEDVKRFRDHVLVSNLGADPVLKSKFIKGIDKLICEPLTEVNENNFELLQDCTNYLTAYAEL